MKLTLKIIGVLVGLLLILTAISGFYQDWLWFSDLGYTSLFWTPILSKIIIQAVNGIILFLFLTAALLSGRHAFLTFYNERLRKRFRVVEEMNRPLLSISQKKITVILLLVSAIISFIISFIVGFTGWLDVLAFLNSSSFDVADPVFNKDLSFYVFKVPFLQMVYNAFFAPLLILTVATILFYALTGVIKLFSFKIWKKDAITINASAKRHIGILLTLLFGFIAFGYYLDIFQLLYSQQGHVVGAGYTDLHATLPVLKVLIVISLLAFLMSLVAIFFKDTRLLTIPLPLLLAVSVILNGALPSLVQSLIVVPNELQKEAPYIANEINMSRFAYGLSNIQEKEYQGTAEITTADLEREYQTINNIRLNDPRPLKQTYTQKQGIRLYYKYNDIDIDRYTVDGQYRQIMLSAREMSTPDLDPKAQTFVNTRFKYTHGFGVTASFANAVTETGLPTFAIKSIPPETEYDEFKLTEPRIYFGELTNDWVVVNTELKEFDYPLGNDNAENNYQGKTGIKMTPFNKIMLSLQQGTLRFYLATEVTSESRILLHRNIIERVSKLAPFLKYDSDPYAVIDEGRIKWIIDAYTTANTLPYSTYFDNNDFNYIRNSVKIVVDAYNGNVDFYTSNDNDPILKTYKKIFPGVFKELSEMPDSLHSHLRYPETMFRIQAEMLNTFHMTNPKVFYNKEDVWSVGKELYDSSPQEVEPYYTIMKLPGEDEAEFILMLPFTPASSETNTRNNMIAWLAARMDKDHYGDLILFKLPKNIEIDGPFQIESRIDQDPEISRQLSLWDQKGSNVIRGNLLALPLAGNFLYVEPVYLQSDTSGSIPEMRRVVVAYEDKLVMTENLDSALTQIFGEETTDTSPPEDEQVSGEEPEPEPEPEPAPGDQDEGAPNIPDLIDQIEKMREMLDTLESQLNNL